MLSFCTKKGTAFNFNQLDAVPLFVIFILWLFFVTQLLSYSV
jgi:hypothetical protein